MSQENSDARTTAIELPICRWRGKVTDGRCVCRSPKLIGKHVAITVCTGEAWGLDVCRYVNHPPPANATQANSDQQKNPRGICSHRGELIEVRKCDLCGIKGQQFEVFACNLHGECSAGRKHSKVKSCLTCQDWESVG